MRRSVLLFEFKFHQEIIPSQIEFLVSAGFDVHVFLDEGLWDDALFECYKGRVKFKLYSKTRKWYKKLVLYFAIKRYVAKHKISHIVVNTLDSRFGNFIIKGLPNVSKTGIAHRIHEINSDSVYKENVRNMNSVLTLSRHTFDYLVANYPWAKASSWFYPVFFCQKPTGSRSKASLSIAVPGQISQQRRDYASLIECAEKLRDRNILVKFLLLGNGSKHDGPAVIQQIVDADLGQYFKYWKDFIPYHIFFEEINAANYVMPLLTPQTENAGNYLQSQISASTNWAVAFKKRLILQEEFLPVLDFLSENAILYNANNLPEVLINLSYSEASDFNDVPELGFDRLKTQYLKSFAG